MERIIGKYTCSRLVDVHHPPAESLRSALVESHLHSLVTQEIPSRSIPAISVLIQTNQLVQLEDYFITHLRVFKRTKSRILTKSCLSTCDIFSTIDQSQRLNLTNLSVDSPDSSLNDVYDIKTDTLMSPTPFKSNLKSSEVKPSSAPSGRTSKTPSRIACRAFSCTLIIRTSAYLRT